MKKMTKIYYGYEKLYFDEKKNEIKKELKNYYLMVPSFGIGWRWLLCWFAMILSFVAWIIPLIIFKQEWIVTFIICSVPFSYFICGITDDAVEKYCDKYTELERQSIKNAIDLENEKENLKCEEWRKNHPLEEKCRLALTKNPNAVADLIEYVKNNCSKED